MEASEAAALQGPEATSIRREDLLQVGDVLVDRASDATYWLAGLLELDDGIRRWRLFRAPQTGEGTWVVELEGQELVVGSETDQVPAGRVPEVLPMEGLQLTLRRRLHASVRREGESLPPSTEQAECVRLAALGGRNLLVIDFYGGERLAVLGTRVEWTRMEHLPGEHNRALADG